MDEDSATKPVQSRGPVRWEGTHVFFISGTDHDDDTIRIPATHRRDELPYRLILPTLCVTFADMRFANDIGGVQRDYPDSEVYGEVYFDPPVELNGEKEVEKYTWIRGAERVTIGPKKTVIEWRGWHDLVIPKLRIRANKKVEALLTVSDIEISVSQPFLAKVQQYADGRHVGGIQVTRRHPDWKPEAESEGYDLLIRVIEGMTRRAVAGADVRLSTWDEERKTFVPEATYSTNEMGIINVANLPCSDKKLAIVERPPWLTQTWRFRPLPGQEVKKHFRLWQRRRMEVPYVWRLQDTLGEIARRTGSSRVEILRMNRLRSDRELTPGLVIKIPCFAAVYYVEARDTLERIAEYFCYKDAKELGEANGLPMLFKVFPDQELQMPGWLFFKAGRDELFEKVDEQFGIPGGWSRPAQIVFHDDAARAYEDEVIAVPTSEFVQGHRLKRLY